MRSRHPEMSLARASIAASAYDSCTEDPLKLSILVGRLGANLVRWTQTVRPVERGYRCGQIRYIGVT
jgi:hypothetical protein